MLRKKAFSSDIFKNFFANIKQEKSPLDVVLNYEIQFSKIFYTQGYTVKSLIYDEYNTAENFKQLIKNGSPFLRKKVFNKEWNKYYPFNTIFIEKYIKNYDSRLIYSIFPKSKINYFSKEFMQYLLKKLSNLRKSLFRINIHDKKINLLGIKILNKNKKLCNCPILKINK